MVVVGCCLLGLLIGSYLGVVADRTMADLPTSAGRSHCDSCGRQLRWFELVPVVSWFVQRGRCRTCGSSIPIDVVAVEVATALLFGATAQRFGAEPELAAYLVLVAGLVVLTIVDLRTMRLPRRIIYVTAGLMAPLLVWAALADHRPKRLVWAGAGAIVAGAFFLAVYVLAKGGMGDGDVRLAVLVGMALGWLGPAHVPVGLFAAFLLGALIGVTLIAVGVVGRRTPIPFAPFMAAGALVAVFAGQAIVRAWLGG